VCKLCVSGTLVLWCHLILQIFDVVFGGVTGYYVSNNVDPDLSASVLVQSMWAGPSYPMGPVGPGPQALGAPKQPMRYFFIS